MENISAKNMWAKFKEAQGNPNLLDIPKTVQFYNTEDAADLHAGLIEQHIKSAWSYPLFALQHKKESLPRIGSHLIVIDGRGTAKCVVQITSMALKPVFSLQDDFIRQEGFKSREQWKNIQWPYFIEELSPIRKTPTTSMILVCTTFKKVYG